MDGRMIRWALLLGICLFVGFWAFVYQGYREDAGSDPVTSWPWGALAYAAAVLIGLRMVRLRRPQLSSGQLVGIGILFSLIALTAALLSLAAGQ